MRWLCLIEVTPDLDESTPLQHSNIKRQLYAGAKARQGMRTNLDIVENLTQGEDAGRSRDKAVA
ncbi:hypothetical protein [Vibrio comitans]|uniref:Uncharacterized protein n=1 Tax=Vibrio comitans NBRC 102076 TaxID=1219078 RepID=A0A4Y3IU41_9VIBR|nr:hypothetical protein [Vibrio comitans]GEA62298.1 hypothetical protein VCO01S_34910 [Vibrio comitans NBRC 102076]